LLRLPVQAVIPAVDTARTMIKGMTWMILFTGASPGKQRILMDVDRRRRRRLGANVENV
jgi:hypothetical protein